MFDNLRDDSTGSFYEDDDSDLLFPEEAVTPKESSSRYTKARKSSKKILGMTAPQRFIIAVMLLIATCTLGTMCLLLTQRIALF